MLNHDNLLNDAPLGKSSPNISHYQRDLLFRIPRQSKREEIGITDHLPFQGNDIWNAFEISWLNGKGKPIVATAELIVPCNSPNLIESKSLKLYLNSLSNTSFNSIAAVESLLVSDLSQAAGLPVQVKLFPLTETSEIIIRSLPGHCLDDLDITCDSYTPSPHFLVTENAIITETLYSDLLKSNCLVTGQPDWGSVQISYSGKRIQHEGLLKYIVSFRNHDEFHEQCVERIFMDILNHCSPKKLFVYARYTRRGGLDINPYRANYAVHQVQNIRLFRQ